MAKACFQAVRHQNDVITLLRVTIKPLITGEEEKTALSSYQRLDSQLPTLCFSYFPIHSPSFHDGTDITIGFGSSHISAFHHWIVIVAWFAEMEDELIDMTIPDVGIAVVFHCQGAGIVDMTHSSIIGSKDELGAFGRVGDRGIMLLKGDYISGGSTQIGLGIEGLSYAHPYPLGGAWHELHQSEGSHIGDGIAVEGTLLIGLGCKQFPVDIALTGILAEEVVVLRYLSFRRIEHRTVDMTTRGIDASSVVGDLDGGHGGELLLMVGHPAVERLGETGCIGTDEPGDGMETVDEMGEGLLTTHVELGFETVGDGYSTGYDIAFPLPETKKKIGLVAQHFYPRGAAYAAGILLDYAVLGAESFAVELEIALRSVEGEDYEFAVHLYGIEIERRLGAMGAEDTETLGWLFLAGHENQKEGQKA